MKPEGLTDITDRMAVDTIGEMYFKKDSGEWESIADITLRSDLATDSLLRSYFPDALVNHNDMVQLRVVNGRLQWMKANIHGGGAGWKELTPDLAKRIDAGETVPGLSIGPITPIVTKEPEPEPDLMEAGWYQDLKGDLYQFDGKTWLGNVPSKKQIETLEFLG